MAGGLLVLAVVIVAGQRLAPKSAAPEAREPAKPAKVRERVATTTLPEPADGIVLDLHFSAEDVEWAVPPISERYLDRLDWRLARLEEKLALSPGQQGRITAWREQVAQRLEAAKTSVEANHFATPRELEAFLRPLLDEDQAAALAAFKKEEQVEAASYLTSSQVSRLMQVVGLKIEQQAEVAAAITKDVEAVVAFRLDDPRPLEAFSSSFDKDPQALGIEQLMWESLGPDGRVLKEDHPLKRRFIKEVRARIESRVESLEGVLTPGQCEAYREYLGKNWADPGSQISFSPLDPER